MTPEIQQLLGLQSVDDRVDELQRELDALTPRRKALDDARASAQSELAATESSIVSDDKRRRELEERLTDHRSKQERNLAALDQVKRIREATAAMAQVEAGRRVLIEEEQELDTLVRRVATSRDYAVKQRRAIEALETSQADERTTLDEEAARIGAELGKAQAERSEQASGHRSHNPFALRSHPCAAQRPRRFSARGRCVCLLRHGDPNAPAQCDGDVRRHRCLRGVWRAALRGEMMLVASLAHF